MSQIQTLGEDFYGNTFAFMSLFPGMKLEFGIWQVNITYVSHNSVSHITSYHQSSFVSNGDPRDFLVKVGKDVRDVEIIAVRQNNFMNVPPTYLRYSMRIDRLYMLNLMCRLLRSRLKT